MRKICTLFLISFSTIGWAQPCGDLFISEYIEGTSNNKALEVYNPTANAINLSGYILNAYNNGGTSVSNGFTFPNKTIAAYGTYVIANSNADPIILAKADTTSSVTFYNGDDAIVLFNGTDTLDIIGKVGEDPGSNWPVGTGATGEFTLVRKATIQEGQKNWAIGATEWEVYPQNTFTEIGMHVSQCAGTLPTAPCSELFFSEYIEGSSNNKAVEIYNPTNAAVNLTGYKVELFNNGGTTPQSSFPLSGSLASGAVYIFCADAANATILAKADTAMAYPSPAHYNGNDAVILLNPSNDTIDAIGVVGVDPGSSWPVDTGSTANYTLIRKATVDAGTKDWTVGATQWNVYPQDTTMFLGAHTSNCLSVMPNPGVVPLASVVTTDVNGVADSLNKTVIVEGLVSGNNLRTGGASGVEFWMIDDMNTAGLLVRNTNYAFYNVAEGDKIWVRGEITQFNGLIQLVPDSIKMISASNTLPAALPVVDLLEINEGQLVVMNNMTIVSGWPALGASSNVVISDGTNNFTLRADSDVFLADSMATAPAGIVNVYGHVGQFDNSNPYTTGYQLLPRYIADVEPVVALTPTINFPAPAQTVLESVGTTTIKLPINPTSATAETVKIYVKESAGITAGEYTTTPAAVNDTIVVNVAAGDSATFDVTVVDDVLTEPNDTVTFTIAKVTAGLTIGATDVHHFVMADDDIVIPAYTISQINTLDADFLLDSMNVYCKLQGVVLGVDLTGVSTTTVQFTFMDATGGFGVYDGGNSGYVVNEGDEVRIIGTLNMFNGLAQIDPDSIVLVSTNNPIPTPVVVTVLDEFSESNLVRMNGMTIVDPTQWTNAGSGFNVDITDGTNTWQMRIDNEVDLYTQPAPVGTFDVIGIGGQFDNSAPHNSGYQLLPRYMADIVYPQAVNYDLHISEIMPGSADPNAAVNGDWFEITNTGAAAIDLTGFSFDDDSETPGTQVFGNVTIAGGEAIVVWRGDLANLADFKLNWRITTPNPQVITIDDLTGSGAFPGLSQSGDAIVLYDTSATPVEVCNAMYTNALAGQSVEFDNLCMQTGNATNGVNGAYFSNGGDQGSPGNVSPDISVNENVLTGVEMYPNPANELLKLELPGGVKNIAIVNMMGQVVLAQSVNTNKVELNLSALNAGVYVIKVSMDGKVFNQTLIVQ